MNGAVLPIVLCAAVTMTAALADYADPSDLYKLALQAQLELEIHVSQHHPDAVALLALGTNHTTLILNSTDPEDAGAHFLAAMDAFNAAFAIIYDDDAPAETIEPDLLSDLTRLVNHYTLLQDVASRYGVDADYDRIDELLSTAATQIREDDEEAADTIDTARQLVDILLERVGIAAAEEDRIRAQKYSLWYQEQLDRLISEAKRLDISDTTLENLRDIRMRLADASEPSVIISIIEEVEDVRDSLDLGHGDRLKLWMLYLEDTVTLFWEDGRMSDRQHNAVTSTLNRIHSLVSAEMFDEASELLVHVEQWLFDLDK